MLPWWQTKLRKNTLHRNSLWKVLAVSQESFPLESCRQTAAFLWGTQVLGNVGFPKCVQLMFVWQNHSSFSAAPPGVWGKAEWRLCNSWWDSKFLLPSLSPLLSSMGSELFCAPGALKQQWTTNDSPTSSTWAWSISKTADLSVKCDSLWLKK